MPINTAIRPESHCNSKKIVADFISAYPKPRAREIIAWKKKYPYAAKEITEAAVFILSNWLMYNLTRPPGYEKPELSDAEQNQRTAALIERAKRELLRESRRDRGLTL